jgi:subtilisin family serine protease
VFPSCVARATTSLVLAVLLGVGGTAGGFAVRADTSTDMPLHVFGWPTSGVPNDTYFSFQTDLASIDVAAAWRLTTGSPDVVVAVLDSGLDASSPEFTGRIVPGFNAFTGAEDGPTDFTATFDDDGHGTHVSGTIAAAADNGAGIAGIAPRTSIMPVKVIDAKGSGTFRMMVSGLNWAVAHGAKIVTLSLGGVLPPDLVTYYEAPFDAAYAAGVVVVAASGNEGAVVTNYPCNFDHVICVGSTTNDGQAVSTFSTRTTGLALVAPGERIASTVPGNAYEAWSGTSMATPHVTASVALMRAVSPSIGVDAVKADLEQTARPLSSGGQNPDSGFGLLQVGAAVALAAGQSNPAPVPNPSLSPTPNASPDPTASPSSSPSASPGPSASPSPDPNASPSPGLMPPDPNASPSPGMVPPDANASPAPSPLPASEPVPVSPRVTSVTPRTGSGSVPRSSHSHLTFSVPVKGITDRTILLTDITTGRRVPIRLAYNATTRIVTLTPVTRLAANHSYRITVTSGVAASVGGLRLRGSFTATFRTGAR